MLEALGDAPALGTIRVEVPGNGSRKERIASIEVRIAEVTIQPPLRRGAHAKASGSSEPVKPPVGGPDHSTARFSE